MESVKRKLTIDGKSLFKTKKSHAHTLYQCGQENFYLNSTEPFESKTPQEFYRHDKQETRGFPPVLSHYKQKIFPQFAQQVSQFKVEQILLNTQFLISFECFNKVSNFVLTDRQFRPVHKLPQIEDYYISQTSKSFKVKQPQKLQKYRSNSNQLFHCKAMMQSEQKTMLFFDQRRRKVTVFKDVLLIAKSIFEMTKTVISKLRVYRTTRNNIIIMNHVQNNLVQRVVKEYDFKRELDLNIYIYNIKTSQKQLVYEVAQNLSQEQLQKLKIVFKNNKLKDGIHLSFELLQDDQFQLQKQLGRDQFDDKSNSGIVLSLRLKITGMDLYLFYRIIFDDQREVDIIRLGLISKIDFFQFQKENCLFRVWELNHIPIIEESIIFWMFEKVDNEGCVRMLIQNIHDQFQQKSFVLQILNFEQKGYLNQVQKLGKSDLDEMQNNKQFYYATYDGKSEINKYVHVKRIDFQEIIQQNIFEIK